MDQSQVAVLDAGLHTVPSDHQIEIVGRIFDPGILLPVVLLKGQGAIARFYDPDHRDQALGIPAEEPPLRLREVSHGAVQPQQIICGGTQQSSDPGHRSGIGGGFPALPFADGLLRDPQMGG